MTASAILGLILCIPAEVMDVAARTPFVQTIFSADPAPMVYGDCLGAYPNRNPQMDKMKKWPTISLIPRISRRVISTIRLQMAKHTGGDLSATTFMAHCPLFATGDNKHKARKAHSLPFGFLLGCSLALPCSFYAEGRLYSGYKSNAASFSRRTSTR